MIDWDTGTLFKEVKYVANDNPKIQSTRQHDACVFAGFALEKARHAMR